jgi:hypothetical protein
MDVSDARLIYLGIPGGEYDLLYQLLDEFSEIKDNARLIISAQWTETFTKLSTMLLPYLLHRPNRNFLV